MDHDGAGRRKARPAERAPVRRMADTGPAARGPADRGLLFHSDVGLRFYLLDANHRQEPVWVFESVRLVAFRFALLRRIGRYAARGMVIRPDWRKALAHCIPDGRCRGRAGTGRRFPERSPHDDIHVFSGGCWNVWLHTSLLVITIQFSDGNGSSGFDWADQFHWKSWRICRSLYCRLLEQDRTFLFRGRNLSFFVGRASRRPCALT